jgi:hypothetical protein
MNVPQYYVTRALPVLFPLHRTEQLIAAWPSHISMLFEIMRMLTSMLCYALHILRILIYTPSKT